jgi:multidrug transporter EmrE-like cation transporter
MSFAWYDILGTVGVAVIVVAYFLLQTGRMRSEQLAYSVMNGVGAVLILISLYYDFNFPSLVVEFFWLLISLYGIARYFRRKPDL